MSRGPNEKHSVPSTVSKGNQRETKGQPLRCRLSYLAGVWQNRGFVFFLSFICLSFVLVLRPRPEDKFGDKKKTNFAQRQIWRQRKDKKKTNLKAVQVKYIKICDKMPRDKVREICLPGDKFREICLPGDEFPEICLRETKTNSGDNPKTNKI